MLVRFLIALGVGIACAFGGYEIAKTLFPESSPAHHQQNLVYITFWSGGIAFALAFIDQARRADRRRREDAERLPRARSR